MSSQADSPVFLLLGGSGGIGRAVASRLTAQECRVVIAGRDAARLGEAAEATCATAAEVDAVDVDAVVELAKATAAEHGRLDGIANLVGSIDLRPAHRTTLEQWRETIDLNLTTAFAAVKAAGTVMKQGGSVVLMSSAAGALGMMNHEAVAAAKAGVEGLARAAAASYARRGLRVNVVAPGLVDTPLAASITSRPAALEASQAMHPLGRIGTPDDVASAVVWLLEPAQSWVTGQVLGVDGGLSRVRA